jgi:hypothetical protein
MMIIKLEVKNSLLKSLLCFFILFEYFTTIISLIFFKFIRVFALFLPNYSIFSLSNDDAKVATKLESRPPESKHPIGPPDINLSRTAF